MTPRQYRSALHTLGWTHERMADYLGKSERHSYRYASGTVEIPDAVAKLIKRVVNDRLTMSERRFDDSVRRL